MTLLEVLGQGSPRILALDDWGDQGLRCVALGDSTDSHRATVVFDRDSTQVMALEIMDPEGVTWVYQEPNLGVDIPGTPIDWVQALNLINQLLEDTDDPT